MYWLLPPAGGSQLRALEAMNKWSLFGAVLFGGVFALFAFGRVEQFDSRAIRFLAAAFVFGSYCALVIFCTGDEKPSLSLLGQTLLGVACALAIAALAGASHNGYVAAGVLGLILGFSADVWAKHIQLP